MREFKLNKLRKKCKKPKCEMVKNPFCMESLRKIVMSNKNPVGKTIRNSIYFTILDEIITIRRIK